MGEADGLLVQSHFFYSAVGSREAIFLPGQHAGKVTGTEAPSPFTVCMTHTHPSLCHICQCAMIEASLTWFEAPVIHAHLFPIAPHPLMLNSIPWQLISKATSRTL